MSPKEVLLNHFNIKENIEKTPQPKKILIINLSQSVTNIDKTKPKINVDCLFSGIFYRSGDTWQSYKILLNEIPTV